MGTLLCLGISITSHLTLKPGALSLRAQAQVLSNLPTLNCPTERQQSEELLFNTVLEQAERAIALGQIEPAVPLMVRMLEKIQAIENSQAKIFLIERLVGSLGENVAHTSPLEQLVQATSLERSQSTEAVLSSALAATQTLSSSYSASKVRTLVTLANYYTQLEQTQQSLAILEQARIASNGIQGTEFRTLALSSIAEAYINAGQPDAAVAQLERSLPFAQAISSSNPYPKAAALARIARLYVQMVRLEQARSVAQLIQVPEFRSAVMLAIADQFSETEQLDRALELLQTVQSSEQKAIALAALAGRATAQQGQQAAQLYAEAVAMARSLQDTSSVLARVALRYVETGGLVAIADETVQRIPDSSIQVAALGDIALAYAQAGEEDRSEVRLTQAIEKLGNISDEPSRNLTRQRLIDRNVERGRYDYAIRITQTIQPGEETPFDRVDVLTQMAERAIAGKRYDAALQITAQIPSSFVSWRDRLFLQLVRGLSQTGELEQALAIARQENADPSFQPRMLAAIAAQVSLAGQTEQATALFEQAIQLANQIGYASTRIEALGAIAQAYLTARQPEQATQLLAQVITVAQTIEDSASHSYTLRTFAEQLILIHHPRAAIQVAEAIPDPSERFAKLNEAIESALQGGDLAIVLDTANRLDNPVLKTRWLLALVTRYQFLGDYAQAVRILDQALQTAQSIPGYESRTIVVRGGENPLSVDDDEDRGSFLVAIALKYAQMEQISQAQEAAQTIENKTLQQQTMQQISCYCIDILPVLKERGF